MTRGQVTAVSQGSPAVPWAQNSRLRAASALPPCRPWHPQGDTVIKLTQKNTTPLQRAGRLFGDFSWSCTLQSGAILTLGKKKGKGRSKENWEWQKERKHRGVGQRE